MCLHNAHANLQMIFHDVPDLASLPATPCLVYIVWSKFMGYTVRMRLNTQEDLSTSTDGTGKYLNTYLLCRDSVVGIATGYGLDDLRGRSSIPGRVKTFLFPKSSRPALGSTQPPIQWVPCTLSPVVKWPGREVDHSPPASAEVKKMWIYTSNPSYALMAQCLIS
jgi:hypothetical protein